MSRPQFVDEGPCLDRTCHYWDRISENWFRCVFCAGESRIPTVDGLCERYTKVTQRDRWLARLDKSRK